MKSIKWMLLGNTLVLAGIAAMSPFMGFGAAIVPVVGIFAVLGGILISLSGFFMKDQPGN